MRPTDEQHEARRLFLAGESMVIEAGAGTGKTSTLRLLAASSLKRGRYMAFNKAIVEDVQASISRRCEARTVHSLAFAQTGVEYAHRLRASGRLKGLELARRLDIRTPITVDALGVIKVLQEGWLGSHVMRAVRIFCQTADEEPSARHFPYVEGIDDHEEGPDGERRRGWRNNRMVAAELEPVLQRAWEDIRSKDGDLPFDHGCYLKLWQLERPQLACDYILFDEAQDANPVMAAVVADQDHAQLVYVGDSAQAIYEWTGAVNALAGFDTPNRAVLSQSFRFGPAIAAVANELLAGLEEPPPLTLRGLDTIDSTVGPLGESQRPDAILTRTNACAITELLRAQTLGIKGHVVGGGTEVLAFAKAAQELKEGGRTYHPELRCFDSWGEVQCLAPGTRVLTESLEWVPIETMRPGDRLLAFDEECGPGRAGRSYCAADVTASAPVVLPSWRLRFSDGTEVVASIDHRWLVRSSGNNTRWCPTERLRIGSEVVSIGRPWEREETHDAGWLAGLWDGEGCLSGGQRGTGTLSLAQRTGPVLDRAERLMKERGFDYSLGIDPRGIGRLTLRGGLADKLRLLGSLRPERLTAKAEMVWGGSRVEARRRARLVAIEDLGDTELVGLATTTQTFIAEGLLSHNSYVAQDPQGGELRLLVDLVDRFGVGTIRRALENMPPEPAAELVVSTAHKAKGREWPVVRLADDFADRGGGDPETRLQYVACTRARLHLDKTALEAAERPPDDESGNEGEAA